MTRKFKFIQHPDHRWYVVMPEWEGNPEDLELVMGADTMLDILAQGDGEVTLYLSTEAREHYRFKLTLTSHPDFGGAYYNAVCEIFELQVWLCYVTEFVFGDYPQEIYIF